MPYATLSTSEINNLLNYEQKAVIEENSVAALLYVARIKNFNINYSSILCVPNGTKVPSISKNIALIFLIIYFCFLQSAVPMEIFQNAV